MSPSTTLLGVNGYLSGGLRKDILHISLSSPNRIMLMKVTSGLARAHAQRKYVWALDKILACQNRKLALKPITPSRVYEVNVVRRKFVSHRGLYVDQYQDPSCPVIVAVTFNVERGQKPSPSNGLIFIVHY